MCENKLPIEVDDIKEAIYRGVYDAMWQMITGATDMPCHDFYDTIKDAIKESIEKLNVEDAIREATKEAIKEST